MKQYHRVLFLAGAVITFMPYVFMLGFGGIRSLRSGQFLMDYLIPGEAFFMVIGGGILMSIGSVLSGLYRKRLIIPCAMTMILLLGGMYLAVFTGVANGSAGEHSPWLYVTIGIFITYDITGLLEGILGVAAFVQAKKKISKFGREQ